MRGHLFGPNWVNLHPKTLHDATTWSATVTLDTPTLEAAFGPQLQKVAEVLGRFSHPFMVEIGSGTGAYALLAEIVPQLSVISIEDPDHLPAILESNIELNALARSRVRLYRLKIREPDAAMKGPGWNLDTFFKEQKLPRVDLILVDVGGIEPLILGGALGVIRHHQPFLVIRAWEANLQSQGSNVERLSIICRKLGYEWQSLGQGYYLARSIAKSQMAQLEGKIFTSVPSSFLDRPSTRGIGAAGSAYLQTLGLNWSKKKVFLLGTGLEELASGLEATGSHVECWEPESTLVEILQARFPIRPIHSWTSNASLHGSADIVYRGGFDLGNCPTSAELYDWAEHCRELLILDMEVHPNATDLERLKKCLGEIFPHLYYPQWLPWSSKYNHPSARLEDASGLTRIVIFASRQPIQGECFTETPPQVTRYAPFLKDEIDRMAHATYHYQTNPYNLETVKRNALALCWLLEAHKVKTVFCPLGCDEVTLLALLQTRSRTKIVYAQSSIPKENLALVSSENEDRIIFYELPLDRLHQLNFEFPPDTLLFVPHRGVHEQDSLIFLLDRVVPRLKMRYLLLDYFFGTLCQQKLIPETSNQIFSRRVVSLLNLTKCYKMDCLQQEDWIIFGVPEELTSVAKILSKAARVFAHSENSYLLIELSNSSLSAPSTPLFQHDPILALGPQAENISSQQRDFFYQIQSYYSGSNSSLRLFDSDTFSDNFVSKFNPQSQESFFVLATLLLSTRTESLRFAAKLKQILPTAGDFLPVDKLRVELEDLTVAGNSGPTRHNPSVPGDGFLTLITTAKAFHGHNGIIQRNALSSWCALQPRPHIILFGNDEGSAAIAAELGLQHVPDVPTSPSGVPLVNGMFSLARRLTSDAWFCYINSDIILLDDFTEAMVHLRQGLKAANKHLFLASARRYEIEQNELVDFLNREKRQLFAESVSQRTAQRVSSCVDLFIFPREMYTMIPELVVGRFDWDTWLVCEARVRGVPIIDCTAGFKAIHQNHDYAHAGGAQGIYQSAEFRNNHAAKSKLPPGGTLHDSSTHELNPNGLQAYAGQEMNDDGKFFISGLRMIRKISTSGSIHTIWDILIHISGSASSIQLKDPESYDLWLLLTMTCAMIGFNSDPSFLNQRFDQSFVQKNLAQLTQKEGTFSMTVATRLSQASTNLQDLRVILGGLIQCIRDDTPK